MTQVGTGYANDTMCMPQHAPCDTAQTAPEPPRPVTEEEEGTSGKNCEDVHLSQSVLQEIVYMMMSGNTAEQDPPGILDPCEDQCNALALSFPQDGDMLNALHCYQCLHHVQSPRIVLSPTHSDSDISLLSSILSIGSFASSVPPPSMVMCQPPNSKNHKHSDSWIYMKCRKKP